MKPKIHLIIHSHLLRVWGAVFAVIASFLLLTIFACNLTADDSIAQSKKGKETYFDTPSALLEGLRTSLNDKNEDIFYDCFDEQASFQICLHQVFRRIQAIFRFRDAIEKFYGKGAWEKFQSSSDEFSTSPRIVPSAIPVDRVWWNKIEIRQERDHAVFYNPLTQMTNTMLSSGGIWKISTRSVFGQSIDRTNLAEYLRCTTGAIEDMTEEISTNKLQINEIGSLLYKKASAKRNSK